MFDPDKLEVYKRAFVFAGRIKKLTLGFPKFELYELGSQMRRASDSIGANIREGCRKRTGKDYISYLHNALGSASEMENHINSSFRDGYIEVDERDELLGEIREISKMIYGVIGYVRKKDIK